MPFQVSPGVNVSEIDLTTVVPAVSTTEAGIGGQFQWGPANTAVLISSEEELVSNFWKPSTNSAADFFTAASFLAYGNALYVVRGLSGRTAGQTTRNATTNAANTIDTIIKNDDDHEDNWSNGRSNVGPFVAKWPGALGNSLKVSTCAGANAWSSTLTGTLSITAGSTTVEGNSTSFLTEVTVGDILVLGPDKRERKVKSITDGDTLVLESAYSGNSVTFEDGSGGFANAERRWEYYNMFDDAPGTTTYANTYSATNDEIHVAIIDEDGEISGTPGQVIERFGGLSLGYDALTESGESNYYKEVINRRSKWAWWMAHEGAYTNAGGSVKLGTTFSGAPVPKTNSFANGRDGNTLATAEVLSAYGKFSNKDEIDVSFLLGAGNSTTVINSLTQNTAEVRMDCLVVCSPEKADVVDNGRYSGAQRDDIIDHRNALTSSSYVVMDSGWKYMYDKYNDVYRWIPCNGDVAGTMVRTDMNRDPWYSPAGFNRGQVKNVVKLAYNPDKADRDQLYKKGVNPIVTFPGQGTVLFGDKTLLAKPSAFDRINVRRLFIVLEKAIARAAQFTLFEFNDEFTRSQFRNLVEPFLRDVQGRRGITDFRVVCDETNNTPEVIDRNEFIGDIYIKPDRSINFIQLNFVAVRTGVDFNEVVGQFG